jgi:V-type H+-transporting ATPase subunit a
MIYMFLSPGNVDCTDSVTGVASCPENVLLGTAGGQAFFQNLLLLVAFVCVPWMLVPKPYILKKRHEASLKAGAGAGSSSGHGDDETLLGEEGGAPSHSASHGQSLAPAAGGGHGDHGHGDHFDFGELMVHQMIHTIEFVLGAVSNTASYLRLWALSLAHSQLSAVFYDRVLMASIRSGSPVAIFVGFFVFACATLGVLMVMESLSAFLVSRRPPRAAHRSMAAPLGHRACPPLPRCAGRPWTLSPCCCCCAPRLQMD